MNVQVNSQLLVEQLQTTIKIYFFDENLVLNSKISKKKGKR